MILKRIFRHALLITNALLLSVASVYAADPTPRKIVLLYSSIGSGHLSAAKAIQARIQEREPGAAVILRDIRDFMNPEWWAKYDEKLFWFVVKKYPATFTKLFNQAMREGVEATTLSGLGSPYDGERLLAFLEEEAPEAIIATHYGSAISLSQLRAQGKLTKQRLGWLHTDYISHYFPRISSSIDKSFLPHPELEKVWHAAGVIPSKVTTTGMPLNPELFKTIDSNAFLISQGLDPKTRTITIASGAEGVGNFPLIVEQLAKNIEGPLQIVAVCARNEKNLAGLEELRPELREGVTLVAKGYIKNEELLSFIKSSDLYITKGGGLSPTEAFAIGKPTLVMDIYGGHESENAVLFERLGLAKINRNPHEIGQDAAKYLTDQPALEKALAAQATFRDALNTDAIVQFALDTKAGPKAMPLNLGQEGGTPVNLTAEAIAKLERASPSQLEILFSTAISPDPTFKSKDANPFGHIAIRVEDRVYTVNQNATRTEDFLLGQSLESYIYGTKSPVAGSEIGSHYGLAYSRDTFGLRLGNLAPEKIAAIHAEIARIQKEWKSGTLIYDSRCNNCADITQRLYGATGKIKSGVGAYHIAFPREVFTKVLALAEEDAQVTKEIIAYTRVPGAKNYYAYHRYPVSLYSPLDYLRRRLSTTAAAKVPRSMEDRIAYRLATYPMDLDVHFETIDQTPAATKEQEKIKIRSEELKHRLETLRGDEARLISLRESIDREIGSETVVRRVREWMNSLPPAELEKVLAAKTGPPAELGNSLKAVLARYARLEKAYDQYNARKLAWLLDYYQTRSQALLSEVRPRLAPSARKQLDAIQGKAGEAYLAYQKFASLYNQPKDVKRIDAFRDFMDQQQKTYDLLNDVAEDSQLNTYGLLRKRIRSAVKKWTKFRTLAPVLSKFFPIFYHLQRETPSTPERTPLVESVNHAFKKLGDQLGFEVTVHGRENIPKLPSDGKTLNFFMIQHSHPQLDNVVLANMGLEPYAIYGAADTFAPKKMADLMEKNDHFIVVGRGSEKPIEKTFEILQQEKIRNFVIYPEGSVSVGMYETRAPRAKFVSGLLARLKAQGYHVNLVPVSMPKNFRLNNNWMFPTDPSLLKIEARIGEAIDSRMVDFLAGTENEQLLNQLLRTIYFENLETHSGRPLIGMPTFDDLLDAIDDQLGAEECRLFFKPHRKLR